MDELDKKVEIVNKYFALMMPSKFKFKLNGGIEWDKEFFLFNGKPISEAPNHIKELVISKGIQAIKDNLKNNSVYTLYRLKVSKLDLSPLLGTNYL